ncbi:MAG: DNA polymerase III subunit beta [Candidatus Levybacteria bacterium]|nr:DNA polymerase III subunit beta [Candidatus Levybacteria bacterium]
MKIYLLSENLQGKLSFVNRAVSLKNQLPILSNILLKAKGGNLKISSTDLEIGIQTEIPANVEEEGGITVPAKTFSELINSLPCDEKISIETVNNNLKIGTQKTKSLLQTIAEDEFPKLYEEKGEKILTLSKETLYKNFSSVIFAASTDSGRPSLSGVLMKRKKNGFSLVATDGYRLSLKDFNIVLKKEEKEEKDSLLIPARVFRELITLKEQDEDINIFVSKKSNQILFEQNQTILVGRLIDALYPPYEKIIPTSFLTSASFDKEEMQKAVKICSIFARESANIIKISIKKDKMIISANTPSMGENTVDVEAKIIGEENEIAFNARYLLDLFSNTQDDEMIFEMTGALNPGVFKQKNNPDFLHIIMPIRVQNSE